MQEQVLQKVKQYIAETEMIKQGCTVIAGVSGGPDSMVMLDILRRIQKEYNFFSACSTRKSRHSWKGSTAGSENGAEDLQRMENPVLRI